MSSGAVARVNQVECVACSDCVAICPFKAIDLVRNKEVLRRTFKDTAEVNPALCKGCGTCAAACRSGCITLDGFDDMQIMAQMLCADRRVDREGSARWPNHNPRRTGSPRSWPFCVTGARTRGPTWPARPGSSTPERRVIRVPCSGRVNPIYIVEALRQGADGVLVSGCHPGDCHYLAGNYFARRRFAMLQRYLEYLGWRAACSSPGCPPRRPLGSPRWSPR